jgi:LysR family transcriptional activator of nhaA
MLPFNYHHLYYFYTIARAGSISKACLELRLAQPTLSSQLKQFEHYLNLKLFERDGRKLYLTDEGRHILSYAREIFETGRELMDGLSDLSHKGRLKIQIGVSSFIPRSVVDALLKFLLKIEPDVYMSVQEDKPDLMIESLKLNMLDLILADSPLTSAFHEDIENHLIAKVPVVFCANAALAKKYKNLPEDLDGAPVLLPTTQSQVYQSVQDYFSFHKVQPKIVGEIQDVELVRRLVLSGIGVAPLNLFTVRNAPRKEPLVVIGKDMEHSIFDNISLMVKKRRRVHPLIPKITQQFKLTW